MQRFRTTADVFAVVKPRKNGTYKCPLYGCSRRKHSFVDSKDFGRHLAIFHKIPSAKSRRKATELKGSMKGVKTVHLLTRFCPNCGLNIEEAEQAAVLLRRTR